MIVDNDREPEFNPARLAIARARSGYTKAALAVALEEAGSKVSTRTLTAWEAGEKTPYRRHLAQLANLLGFPEEFFWGETLEPVDVDSVSFRALSRMSAARRDRAIAAATIGVATLGRWLDERFRLPDAAIPDLGGIDPETAAAAVRSEWGLGEAPIANVIHMLEAHGVRVYSLAEMDADLDGFSFWRDGTPYVFLNTNTTAERSRMDACHELGHLVMHRNEGHFRGKTYEREATAFGSALLMPRGSVLARAPRGGGLDQIIEAKQYWRVSAKALTMRMYGLGLLSEWQHRSVFIELARRGHATTEPASMPRETSRILEKVFASLRDEGVSKSMVAAELRLPQAELDKLIFGLAVHQRQGGDDQTDEPMRPSLRIVH